MLRGALLLPACNHSTIVSLMHLHPPLLQKLALLHSEGLVVHTLVYEADIVRITLVLHAAIHQKLCAH